jgi:peroxiredoxin
MFLPSMAFSLSLAVAGVQATAMEYGPQIGQQAPDFSLKDATGAVYQLSDFQGKKTVVLEFVRSGSW